jgi:predicted DsbA family dithiol-disulfide isomerase
MAEVLFRFYWLEGKDIGDFKVLSDAATLLGIPNSLEYLKSDEDVQTICNLEKKNTARAVPQFRINGR